MKSNKERERRKRIKDYQEKIENLPDEYKKIYKEMEKSKRRK